MLFPVLGSCPMVIQNICVRHGRAGNLREHFLLFLQLSVSQKLIQNKKIFKPLTPLNNSQ